MKQKAKPCLMALTGSVILGFGLYQVHSFAGVTEGGILGLTLLLQHWFRISPAVSGFVLNLICYLIGWRTMGKDFLLYSAVAAGGYSLSYGIFEQFPPLWPELYTMPLLAAVLGAVFVGIGVGLSVRAGGAPMGDDALAMSVSRVTNVPIQWVYLVSDLLVLALSVSYIPLKRMGYSLLTVILSGQLVGWIQNFKRKERYHGTEHPEDRSEPESLQE